MTTLRDHTAPPRTSSTARPRASRVTDAVTLVLSGWLTLGAIVDAWAHVNLGQLETFFTPWHALLYSGYAAVAGWIGWQVVRTQERGGRGLAGVPVGYGLGLAGLGVFAVGAVGDLMWHEVFGIETDINALLSPTHLVLFGGGLLIVSTPLRSAWNGPTGRDPGSLWQFLVPLLSLGLVTAGVSYFFMFVSAFASDLPALGMDTVRYGAAEALITNVLLLYSVLFLLKRWQPPFGAVTVLFTLVAVLMNAIFAFVTGATIVPAVLGGLAADTLIRRLRPSVDRPVALQMVAAAIPFGFWALYYLTFAAQGRLAWDVESWSGLVVFNSLAGFALARLQLPSRQPAG